MRKTLSSVAILIVLLGTAGLCRAQEEPKPLVTVSFAGYDALMANIDTIGQIGGTPDMGKGLDMMLRMMTQGKGLAGLDTARPWGAVVLADDQQALLAIGFVPVTDLKQLVELTKPHPQLANAISLKNGVYEINAGGMPIYMKQKGEWAFLSGKKENLAKAPADPLKALGDLPQKYTLAVRASIKNLPKELREQLLAQLRAGAEVGMQQMPTENEDDYALRLNMAKQTTQWLTALSNDVDELLLGWTVDYKTKSTYLDLDVTAREGTKLAEQFAQIKPGETKLAGLLPPDAAVTFRSVGLYSDAQVAQAKASVATLRKSLAEELEKQGLSKDEVELTSRLIGDVLDVLEKTVEARNIDVGLAVLVAPKAVTYVAGAEIVDGAKLEQTVEKVLDELQKSGKAAAQIKVSNETYQGMSLHMLSLPTPEPDLVPLVGDTLDIVIGVADDKALIALGRDAAKTLKQAIDRMKSADGEEVPPLQIVLAVRPLAEFAATVADNQQAKAVASMLAGLLQGADGKDRVTLTATPIPLGVRVRLELEEGLVKVLGAMGQMGAMPPPGAFGPQP